MLFKSKDNYKNKKSLIIYFSRGDENYAVGYINKGNTEVIAEYIKDLTNADMIKIEPKIPYAKDYDTCIKEAKERQKNHKAFITKEIGDITPYDVIYIGSPVYWSYMPEELVTALKGIDFSNKIIRPFVTHEGSNLGDIPNQIKDICKNATVLDGLAIKGSMVNGSKLKVEEWL